MMNLTNITNCTSSCTQTVESSTEKIMRYVICVSLVIIIVISLVGNAMVCIAFKLNAHLRTISNWFILSLAISDLLTTILVMPWDLDAILKKGHWPYGKTLCKIYTTGYLISAPASTLNLLAVSIDRFRMIRDPFTYRRQTTPFRVFIVIICIWTYSIIIAFLPIMGWNDSEPRLKDNLCEFDITWRYSIMVSFFNFVIPPLIMTVTYFKIYRIAKGHIQRIHRLESVTLNGKIDLKESINLDCRKHQLQDHVSKITNDELFMQDKIDTKSNAKMLSPDNGKHGSNTNPEIRSRNKKRKRKSRSFSFINGNSLLRKNVKAAKSLAIIVGAFFICWYPFTIMSMVLNACQRSNVTCVMPPMYVEQLLLAFGFLNSALNPFLYAFHNKEFKKTYKRMFKVQFSQSVQQ
ncbi:D(1) dopamine receptor-like [Xenia sp. Carnegie-2017]|uniref:D(1) dopamine receptor-like n=1 Tax=Xenia sp. Carnegie-2017 TaxID=2897299 RepID=UPI001F04D650|nr:D(1) dopamine receptor-like [Xenia sp. Carnegie-2017]